MLREKENQVSTGDMGSGTMEYILPYDTPLKPRCRPRYAVRMNGKPSGPHSCIGSHCVNDVCKTADM